MLRPLDFRAFGHVLRVVAGRRINDFRGSAERVEHRAGATPATADQADLDFQVRFGRCRMDLRQSRKGRQAGHCDRCLSEKLAT